MFTPLERLVLQYADGITISGLDAPDDLFAELQRHFSEEAIVELTAHIAFENFRSKFNHALRIEAQGFCRIGKTPSRAQLRTTSSST
jgi:alkylhydroperoxidase family enzyme